MRCDPSLCLDTFYINTCNFLLLPLFITPFGVAVRGKGKLNILALISPYSEKPNVRHVSEFHFSSFTSINTNFVTHFYQGKATLKMLALTFPYSENTIR